MITRLQSFQWKVPRFLPRRKAKSSRAGYAEGAAAAVRLIETPRRLPATPIEQALTSALKEIPVISMTRLVKEVAANLYAEELRKGAGVLDIGLYGDRLFNEDIVRELRGADGILWEIKQNPTDAQRKSVRHQSQVPFNRT
jgi:hypothetical protein